MNILVLIDNGHGNPPLNGGKCSPDNRFKEYDWAREIAQRVSRSLTLKGIDCLLLTPEKIDISLRERTRRANAWCRKRGAANCLLLSIHVDAAPGNGWNEKASGWSAYVAPVSSEKSKIFARLLYDQAELAGLKGNRSVPQSRYWVGNFAIIRDTLCPAVLTENLFMTNHKDLEYLMSEQGKQTITDLHVSAIINYIHSLKQK